MGEFKAITKNKKAFHEYHILETFEAGIALTGTEVKSIRRGKVNLKDSYAKIENGEIILYKVHISPYEEGNRFNHDPLRSRKLLMHKYEINRLIGKIQEKGLALIPISLYFNEKGKVKLSLAVGKGKNLYDKRQDMAAKDAKRDMERSLRVKE